MKKGGFEDSSENARYGKRTGASDVDDTAVVTGKANPGSPVVTCVTTVES